jgi:DivIVA domain-containing protein
MASELNPEQIRAVGFRTVRRGLDPDEVAAFLQRIAATMEEMEADRQRLATKVGEFADRDLESEFESLGREVAAVLTTAKQAADSMRENATLDAARWRSEAMSEVEETRKEARSDSEALRGDAWASGTELLNQASAEARRIRGEAEQDVLSVMGEAEREAHRLTSSARREAEDLMRSAMMDAEKLASEAKKRHDDLIEQAYRQAEGAQERTRALEERREELMLELETVRSTLSRLEGTLEERREDLELSKETTSVRVVPARTEPGEVEWELGETVRVIAPTDRPPDSAAPSDSPFGELDEELSYPEREPEREPEPEPEPEAEPEPAPEPERMPEPGRIAETRETEPIEPEPEVTTEEVAEPEPGADDVGALFASLRGTPAPAITVHPTTPLIADTVEPETGVPPVTVSEPVVRSEHLEMRDSRLLPITNRALRGVKKAVTDAQNVALDNLRTDEAWQPESHHLAEMMQADLKGLWAESYSAGHSAAEEMTGARLKRGVTPSSNAADEFGEALAGAVSTALVDAGEGLRARQTATSRVFRGWRTDEAERRVRQLALTGYHRGLADSVGDTDGLEWIPSGTPCSACREAAAEPETHLPPIHAGCECTLVLAGARAP